MLIAQISDPHVTTEGTAIRALVDTPQRLIDAFDLLRALPQTPDVILLTGDLVNDATPEEYDLLKLTLAHSPSPILPIPGNHDDPAQVWSTFDGSPWCEVPLPPPPGKFHYATDHYATGRDAVRFVALDTTVPERHSGEVTEADATWLHDTLSAAPETPTVVFTHHVPYPTGAWWFDYNGVAGADLLRAVLAEHSQVIRAVSGHVHRATSTQWGPLTLSSAPSTAHLAGTGVGDAPPLLTDERSPVTLFEWDGTRLLASVTELPGQHKHVLNLADLSRDWAAYEPLARQGGPILKSEFD